MKHFEQQLDSLKRQVLAMSAEVESMLDAAGRALVDQDPETLHQAMAHEPRIDQFQIDIDTEAVRLICLLADRQGPAIPAHGGADQLGAGAHRRPVVEQLSGSRAAPSTPRPKPLRDLVKMSQIARQMLMRSRPSTTKTSGAEQVVATDDEIDALYVQTFRDLLVEGNVDPVVVNESMTMILLARSLERIADHATNICEEVIYLVKGEDIRHQRSQQPRAVHQRSAG